MFPVTEGPITECLLYNYLVNVGCDKIVSAFFITYLYLRFSSHRWGHHVWGESCRRVLARLLLLDQPHSQCELLRVQFALLINVTKIPENVQVMVSFLAVIFFRTFI